MLSVLRIVAALLFMQHGMQKIFAFPPPATPLPPFHFPSLFGLAGILELLGGSLLLIGLLTRPIAFILSGEMAFAYFIQHAPNGFWPILNRGELAALLCFLYLYLAFAGGGAWSVDRLLARPTGRLHEIPAGMPERRAVTRREGDRRRAS